jgi:hypothetical protein
MARFWPSTSMEGRSVRSASSAIRLGLTVDRLANLSFIHPSASEAMIRVFQDHSIGQGTKDQRESRVEKRSKLNPANTGQRSGQKSCITGHFSCILPHDSESPRSFTSLGKNLIPSDLGWLRGRDLNPRPSGYEPDHV